MADSKAADVAAAHEALLQDASCCNEAKSKLVAARDKFASLLHDLNAKAEELGHCVKEKAKAGVEKSETCIKDHPFASVGIALGVGLGVGIVVGLLINRSRH
jgi:ElaB/YqjD/DUF883 family membrane-anchored ribosome-binding protein